MFRGRRFLPTSARIVILCVLVVLSGVSAANPQAGSTESAVGQTLKNTLTQIKNQQVDLENQIEALDRDYQAMTAEKNILTAGLNGFSGKSTFDAVQLVMKASVGVTLIWVTILFVMYRRIRKPGQGISVPTFFRCFLALLVLAFMFFLSASVGASSGIIQLPKSDLTGTVQAIESSASEEPWQRVLRSLEEPNCEEVGIPEDIMQWISSRCPVNELINPIQGQGPHRLTAIASIYWASGQKEKAVEVIRPVIDEKYSNRLSVLKSCFKTCLVFFSEQMETELATKTAGVMIPSMSVDELLSTAGMLRSCCLPAAMDCLQKAKASSRSAEDTIHTINAFREFSLFEDADTYLASNIKRFVTLSALKLCLDYLNSHGLIDQGRQVVQYNIDIRESSADLLELASFFFQRGEKSSARLALDKSIQIASRPDELIRSADAAFGMQSDSTAGNALKKIIDISGYEGALLPFPDPLVLDSSQEKPVDSNPSVGIVIAMLLEKNGEKDSAESYYTSMVNLELFNSYACPGMSSPTSYVDLFYACRFFSSHGKNDLVNILLPVAGRMESQIIEQARQSSGISELQKESQVKTDRNSQLNTDIKQLKKKIFYRRLSAYVLVVYSMAIACVMIMAQVVAVRRMMQWIKGLHHFRIVGGFLKLLEMEGFILLASVVLSPIGFLLILKCQFFQSFILSEAYLFRVSEEYESSLQPRPWPRLPLIYRDKSRD